MKSLQDLQNRHTHQKDRTKIIARKMEGILRDDILKLIILTWVLEKLLPIVILQLIILFYSRCPRLKGEKNDLTDTELYRR